MPRTGHLLWSQVVLRKSSAGNRADVSRDWRTLVGAEVDAVKQDDREAGVHDDVALDEIRLYGEVLSAVAEVDRPLNQHEIDVILGVFHGHSPADLS